MLGLTAANVNDAHGLVPMLDALEPIRSGRRGRPRCRPGKLHADKGYDQRRCRAECRRRGICARIARKGIESSQRLGRHRWVAERTIAWLAQFKRLLVRFERIGELHLALLTLGGCLILARHL